MTFLQALLLGLTQGLTEFLPVSSSGHLVILQRIFGFEHPPLAFDVLLHIGTLLAIIVTFSDEIKKADLKLIKAIVIGSIPTGIIGLLLNTKTDSLFNSLPLVGLALIATSLILISTKFIKSSEARDKKEISTKTAILVGIAQGLAIVPGISRSGATIVAGLWMGLGWKKAVVFSFLLSIPAILGAQLLQFSNSLNDLSGQSDLYFAGFLAAVISGILSIKAVKVVVKKSKLHLFAIYTFILATLILLF